jgi:hypothetical protein
MQRRGPQAGPLLLTSSPWPKSGVIAVGSNKDGAGNMGGR